MESGGGFVEPTCYSILLSVSEQTGYWYFVVISGRYLVVLLELFVRGLLTDRLPGLSFLSKYLALINLTFSPRFCSSTLLNCAYEIVTLHLIPFSSTVEWQRMSTSLRSM